MKVCTGCWRRLSLGQFNVRRLSSDGLQFTCRECNATYHEANREKIAARYAIWHEANREERLAHYKAYNKADPVGAELRATMRDERRRAAQSFSVERAVRSGLPWAAWEDAEVIRNDRTPLETALRLGRTLMSIVSRRQRVLQQAA